MLHYDPQSLKYVEDDREIPDANIKRLVFLFLAGVSADLQALSKRMIEGELSIDRWQLAVMDELEAAYVAVAAIAAGGIDRLTHDDLNAVSADLRFAFTRLERFARHVEAHMPRAATESAILSRIVLYSRYANGVYEEQRRRAFKKTENESRPIVVLERNVLGVAEHCDLCVSETERGWVFLGDLILPGRRTCLANCKCHLQFIYFPLPKPNAERSEVLAAANLVNQP